VGSPLIPQTGVTAITNPGSITGLLPVITPGPSATSPTVGLVTSPAAANPASPGTTTDQTSASNFVLVVPTATAEKIAVVILAVLIAVALRLRARDKFMPRAVPGRASRGAHGGPSPVRRRKPSVILHLRRQRGDSLKKTPS
jgi:hypothetical protein